MITPSQNQLNPRQKPKSTSKLKISNNIIKVKNDLRIKRHNDYTIMPETEKRKQYKKDWFNNHSDEWKANLIEKQKKYYLDNQERLKGKGKEKITCECGTISPRWNLARHKKSKKHQKLLVSNNIII